MRYRLIQSNPRSGSEWQMGDSFGTQAAAETRFEQIVAEAGVLVETQVYGVPAVPTRRRRVLRMAVDPESQIRLELWETRW